MEIPHYSYRVFWSDEDGEYVAVCDELPGLSGLAENESEALAELRVAIEGSLAVLREKGERIPEPNPRPARAVG